MWARAVRARERERDLDQAFNQQKTGLIILFPEQCSRSYFGLQYVNWVNAAHNAYNVTKQFHSECHPDSPLQMGIFGPPVRRYRPNKLVN